MPMVSMWAALRKPARARAPGLWGAGSLAGAKYDRLLQIAMVVRCSTEQVHDFLSDAIGIQASTISTGIFCCAFVYQYRETSIFSQRAH